MSEHSHPDEAPMLRVAEAISDGDPVNWEEATAQGGESGAKLSRLRIVEAIARANRELPPVAAFGPGGPAPFPLPADMDESGVSTPVSLRGHAATAPEGKTFPPTPARWGRLQNLRRIGAGGFGEVFRAYDTVLQRDVALKLARLDRPGGGASARDFLREARLLARVRHPNVMVVHGADWHDGRVGLWSDIIDGRTLEECLKEQGPFSAHEAALIGIHLCAALAAVHGAGLVHRDVKTTNVMRAKGGQVVLMDFGTASGVVGSHEADGKAERAGTLIAMAPEVLLQGHAPRPEADIFGLGVLLYRLVSGKYPIEAIDQKELIERHRLGRVVPLRDVRPDLLPAFVQVVERALANDPAKRYSSAGAMEQALAASLISPQPLPNPRPMPHSRALYAAAAVAVIALCAGLWGWWPNATAVETSLFREVNGERHILRSGARIRPGERLGLEVIGSEPLYSYVLNEDASGAAVVLFPAGLDLTNPIPPGIRAQLPGRLAGIQQYWIVTSAGGTETILVIVSREPLSEIENAVNKLPRAEVGRQAQYAPIESREVTGVLRGIHGIGPSPRQGEAGPGRLRELAALLPADSQVARGVWVYDFTLENPGPEK